LLTLVGEKLHIHILSPFTRTAGIYDPN
jgi:hypothetical protein